MKPHVLLVLVLSVSGVACSSRGTDSATSAHSNKPPEPDKTKAPEPDKTKAPVTSDAAPAASPTCAADVAAFGEWLGTLMSEGRVELDFTFKLQVIERKPGFVADLDEAGVHANGSISVFDVGTHNHVGPPGDFPADAKPAELEAYLKTVRDKPHAADADDAGPDDELRLSIDAKAPWSAVALTVRSAARAGYARATFVFTATSAIETPPVSAVSPVLEKSLGDGQDMVWKRCRPVRSWIYGRTGAGTRPARAAEYAKAVPQKILECGCAVDFADVKTLIWYEERGIGVGKSRIGVTVPLATKGAKAPVTAPRATPWSEAYRLVLAAADAGGPLDLTAK